MTLYRRTFKISHPKAYSMRPNTRTYPSVTTAYGYKLRPKENITFNHI